MRKYLYIFLFISAFFTSHTPAFAADIYMGLSTSQVTEQSTFTGTVYISTDGQNINNAEGIIQFPTDLLSVESVSNAGSIFNFWIEQPTFSNSTGLISWNGGLPNPGFLGQTGTILQVVFKAKKAGTANINFNTVAIRANDGVGTNVINLMHNAAITIGTPVVAPVVPVVPQPVVLSSLPNAPKITSSDMPDENAWYSLAQATFSWVLTNDITAVQLGLNAQKTTPTVVYEPAIANKLLTNLDDGVMYLNARFKNALGWGNITHRKIQIDSTAPQSFSARAEIGEHDLISIALRGTDALSGMKKYAVLEGTTELATQKAVESDDPTYVTLPPLSEGEHTLYARGYDLADNFAEIEIKATAPRVAPPEITDYPKKVSADSEIVVQGTSYPHTDILIWMQHEDGAKTNYSVKTNEYGQFVFTTHDTKHLGTRTLWAEAHRAEGVISSPSETVRIDITQSGASKISGTVLKVVAIVITIGMLVFALLVAAYTGLHRIKKLRRIHKRDMARTEQEIHAVFTVLKKDIRRHLDTLEAARLRRRLTREESEILVELSEDIDDAESAEKHILEKIKTLEPKKKRTWKKKSGTSS